MELTQRQAQALRRAVRTAVQESGGLPDGALLLSAQIYPDQLTYVYVIPGDTPQPTVRCRVDLGDAWWS